MCQTQNNLVLPLLLKFLIHPAMQFAEASLTWQRYLYYIRLQRQAVEKWNYMTKLSTSSNVALQFLLITVLDWTKTTVTQCPPKCLATKSACLASNKPGKMRLRLFSDNKIEAQPGLAVSTSPLSDIQILLYKKTVLESKAKIGGLAQLHAGEEGCLRPSLVQLVKEGDSEQKRKLTGDSGITAVCYLTPATGKKLIFWEIDFKLKSLIVLECILIKIITEKTMAPCIHLV